ncbi:non-ribosomal peptide synthetase [Janthinobacterium sp. CG3]|uniref:non-ribosomal peptide synthetase n=1 Tax=Janthinobacterium sp. CG3 TaxID=1075768 RepID=UPI000348510F
MIDKKMDDIQEAGELYALSPQQKHLWSIQENGSPAYRSQCAIEVSGAVDKDRLRKAVRDVVSRHEVLRTRFIASSGTRFPRQMVADEAAFVAQEYDFSLDLPSTAPSLEALWQEMATLHVDLVDGPALHYAIAILSEHKSLFLLCLPALYSDKTGLETLAREIWHSYASLSQGARRPDEPVQYVDLSEWLNTLLESDERAAGRGYWAKQGQYVDLPLPLDRTPYAAAAFQPRSVDFAIDASLMARIDDIVGEKNISVEAFLFSCWQCLIARLTLSQHIPIRLGSSGRRHAEVAEAVGLLGKYVPVHALVEFDQPFLTVLMATAQSCRDAHEWQEYFHAADAAPGGRTYPLFFELTTWPQDFHAADLSFSFKKHFACIDRFKILLSCARAGKQVNAQLAYDAQAFSEDYVKILAKQYLALLASALQDPHAPVSTLVVVGEDEKRSLLVDFNDTDRDYPSGPCLHQLFEEQAGRTPAKIAVSCGDQQLSYAELNGRANQLAGHLRGIGVTTETLVGVCLERSLDLVVALLGILKAGGAYVPLDPAYPSARLAYMLEHAGPRVLLTQDSLLKGLPACSAQLFCMDRDWPMAARHAGGNPEYPVEGEHIAYVIYTSGSTGKPKGVQVPHRGVVNFLHTMRETPGVAADDVVLNVTSLSFDIAVLEVFLPLVSGARTVLCPGAVANDPQQLAALIERAQVTVMQATPVTWRMLAEHGWPRQGHQLKVLCGGEALPIDLARQLLTHVPAVWNMYGPTETTVWSTLHCFEQNAASLSIGRPVANTRIYVLDEHLNPVPIGVAGELHIAGEGVARGYLNRPDLTGERFIPDPFSASGSRMYKTGDLARYLPDGAIECLGRMDHQVKIRGFRIELEEIETALAQHAGVREAVVLAREDAPGDKRLVAYVVPHTGDMAAPVAADDISFSLFYFGADTYAEDNKYQLYLESAKFADEHGFEALWTPERHFHQVGSLYPNPSVLNAALAVLTKNVKLRAGSVVLPLHHPARVAEEWAVVDNLSHGRVGLAIAAGWHPRDFVLAPGNFAPAARLAAVRDGIQTLQALWAGEAVTLADGAGKFSEVRVFPRPVQPELPLWITAAGNIETFLYAAQIGANVLTHLLGQTVEEVAEKIKLYRTALLAHGHDPATRTVTLMVHTFVGGDFESTLRQARGPFMNYMRAHLGLMESLVKSLNISIDNPSAQDLEHAVEFAFERYSRSASLIGTPETCLPVVHRLKDIGVDEIACMVDWMDTPDVLAGLASLQVLRERARMARPVSAGALQRHCRNSLPDYMVPSAVVLLDQLPLTQNGKIDRKALPAPEVDGGDVEYLAPRTALEENLAAIWRQVLKCQRVGILDNFFHIGGDSILAIQVIARSRQGGLHFTPKQLFQHPTIFELAPVVEFAAVISADQGRVDGAAPLTPIQHWFFAQDLAAVEHFNQSLFFTVRQRLDVAVLKEALEALVAQHDALRLGFARSGDGWRQAHQDSVADKLLTSVDLAHLNSADQLLAMQAGAQQMQAECDLAAGPLFRVGYFQLGGQGSRLLLVCHHLIIDGISWRILLEDLQTAYLQRLKGQPIALPLKTSSFKEWGERLTAYAASAALAGEVDFWAAASAHTALPADALADALAEVATAGSSRTLSVELNEHDTGLLLSSVPAAYRTQINDVLLTALALAMTDWLGGNAITISVEGHGREDLFPDADFGRTVGWFTSLFPVRLELGGGRDYGTALKAVKEQLRALPNKGIGYGLLRYLANEPALSGQPAGSLCFNYLGQTGQELDEAALFEPASEPHGSERARANRAPHDMEVNAIVVQGRLSVGWDYRGERFAAATVAALAQNYLAHLQGLIRHCTEGAGGYTPSDFPLVKLKQSWLDARHAQHDALEDMYPLTSMQQGVLFHAMMAPESGVYVQQMRCTLDASMDLDAFEQALQTMVDRHAALRAAVVWQDVDVPMTVVHAKRGIAIARQDWRGLSDGDRQLQMERFLADDRRQGFDLSQAPLQRFALIRLEDEAYHFVWTCHYLLFDGWSFAALLQELLANYTGLVEGRPHTREPVRPFRDYVAWLQRQDLAKAEDYWRAALAGFAAPTPLSIERRNPQRSGYAERQHSFGAALTQSLSALVQGHGITMNTFTQGVWAILLSRYSQQDDVVFGSTVSGRPAEIHGIESMIGLFINSLPVRTRVPREANFIDWLKQLQVQNVEMRQFEFAPLTRIQSWSEIPSGLALFDSLFVFENFPVDESLARAGHKLAISQVRVSEQTNFPLTLTVVGGARLSVSFSYDRGRFDDAAIERLVENFKTLVESIAASPNARIEEFTVLSPAERDQLLVAWNQTGQAYPTELCIQQLFEAQVARTPERVALSCAGVELSYAQLNQRANRVAHLLRRQGIGPGAVVGVCLERNADLIVALLAVLKAGAAYLPLDPDYPRERIAFMLDDAGVALVLAHARFQDLLSTCQAPIALVDEQLGQAEAGDNPAPLAGARDLAYVIYTSGSTGQPKGVAIEHRATVTLLHWARDTFTPEQRAGMLASTSVCFDLSVFEIFVPLSWGGRILLIENALHLPALQDKSALTFINTVPSAMTELVRMGQVPASVKVVGLAGEPLQNALVQSIYQAGVDSVYNLYGPSEDTTYSTFVRLERGSTQAVSIGRPIANTRLYILDARMEPVPLGVAGELYIGGDGLARGYLHRAELTREKFIADPFSGDPAARLYKTGDLVRYRADGQVDFLGRLDHQVKLRGYRIELGDIEAALLAHGQVREAVLQVREDQPGDRRLVAYLVAATAEAPGAAELRAFLQDKLPGYMIPSAFVPLPQMPLTPNGKIDRKALPAPQGAALASAAQYLAPASATEKQVAAIWRTVLGVERVGVHDNFFDLGGHSLLLLQAYSKFGELAKNGATLSLVDLFAYPTVRALADHIDQNQGGRQVTAEKIQQQAAKQKQSLRKNRQKHNGSHNVR